MRGPSRVCGLVLLAGLTALPLAAQSGPLAAATVALEASAATSPFQTAERNRVKGALWGAGVGLVAGGLLGGLTAGSDDDGFGEGELVEAVATGQAVIVGAVVGTVVGALLGATVFAPSRSGSAEGSSGLTVHAAPYPPGTGAGLRIGLRWVR